MSRSTDAYRVPYGKATKDFPRHSIIVGSVNDSSFLADPTGSRRYWVIPVKVSEIDTALLAQERDGIWAAAVAAYKQGET